VYVCIHLPCVQIFLIMEEKGEKASLVLCYTIFQEEFNKPTGSRLIYLYIINTTGWSVWITTITTTHEQIYTQNNETIGNDKVSVAVSHSCSWCSAWNCHCHSSFVLSLGEHMSQTKTIYRESFASLCICLTGTFLPEYVLFSSSWRVADDFDAK
jgi:uncharacterized membrane protein YkvI